MYLCQNHFDQVTDRVTETEFWCGSLRSCGSLQPPGLTCILVLSSVPPLQDYRVKAAGQLSCCCGFRMRSSALLLLVFCCSAGQTRSQVSVQVQGGSGTVEDVYPELPVLWDELRGLKELVLSLRVEGVGQRQALRSVESRLMDGEGEAQLQRHSLDHLQEVLERQVDELRRRLEDLEEQSKGQEPSPQLPVMSCGPSEIEVLVLLHHFYIKVIPV